MNKDLEISNIIDRLGERWIKADKTILREVFPILASGEAVSVNRLMEITTAERSMIESALRLGRAGLDGNGNVHEIYGVDLNPSLHRGEVDGTALFTCCALVAHMLPFILDQPIQMESIDPVTRKIVRMSISPETEMSYEPKSAVATLVRVEQSLLDGDISSLFCNHVNHFASLQSADQFVSQHPGRFIVGIDTIREAGKKLYAKVWT